MKEGLLCTKLKTDCQMDYSTRKSLANIDRSARESPTNNMDCSTRESPNNNNMDCSTCESPNNK